MPVKIDDKLKKAIVAMPEREKDKLLLRLVAKDAMLVKRLHHQLLEDEADMEIQREDLLKQIDAASRRFAAEGWNDTPGWLMMQMRDFSGSITSHVKITKDKLGEIELLLLLVNSAFRDNADMLYSKQDRADKFRHYVAKKAQMVLKKLKRVNRDYYIEFEEPVNQMLQYLKKYPPTARVMAEYELPGSWEA